MKRFFRYLVCLLSSLSAIAQNDLCTSTPALSTGTTAGATTTAFTNTGDPVPSCESAANKYSYTGWYKYTTGASGGSLTISMASNAASSGIKWGALTLYSGSCGSFTELSCSDPNNTTYTSP